MALGRAKKKSAGSAGILLAGLAVVAGVGAFLHFSRRSPATSPAGPSVVVLPTAPAPATSGNPMTAPAPGNVSETVPAPPPVVQHPPPEVTPDPAAPAVDPAAPAPVTAKADVPAFLATARRIMRDKAKAPITEYATKLRGNVSAYQSDAGRGIARMKAEDRTKFQAALGEEINGWKAAGNRVCPEIPPAIEDIPGIQAIHADYLRRQAGFDSSFNQAIDKFADTYVLGLQLQIDRYRTAADPGAADSLDSEIKETRADAAYFRNLMAAPPESAP